MALQRRQRPQTVVLSGELQERQLPASPEVLAAVTAIRAQGWEAVERIDNAALTVYRGALHLEAMSLMESAIARRDPISADRVSGLIEDFLLVTRCEIRAQARGR